MELQKFSVKLSFLYRDALEKKKVHSLEMELECFSYRPLLSIALNIKKLMWVPTWLLYVLLFPLIDSTALSPPRVRIPLSYVFIVALSLSRDLISVNLGYHTTTREDPRESLLKKSLDALSCWRTKANHVWRRLQMLF